MINICWKMEIHVRRTILMILIFYTKPSLFFSTDVFEFSSSDDSEGGVCRNQRQEEIISSFERDCPSIYPTATDTIHLINRQQRVQESNFVDPIFDISTLAALSQSQVADRKLKILAAKLTTRASARCTQLIAACGDIAKTIVQNISISYQIGLQRGKSELIIYLANTATEQILLGIEDLGLFFNKLKLVFTAPAYVQKRVQTCKKDAKEYFKAGLPMKNTRETQGEIDDCIVEAVARIKSMGTTAIGTLVASEAVKATMYHPISTTLVTSIASPFTTLCESAYMKCFNSTYLIGRYISRAIVIERPGQNSTDAFADNLCGYVERVYKLFTTSVVDTLKDLQNTTKLQEKDIRDAIKGSARFFTSNLAALASHIPPFIYPPS